MSRARQRSWGSTRDPSSTKDRPLLAVLSHQNVSFTLTECFILLSRPPNYREPSKSDVFCPLAHYWVELNEVEETEEVLTRKRGMRNCAKFPCATAFFVYDFCFLHVRMQQSKYANDSLYTRNHTFLEVDNTATCRDYETFLEVVLHTTRLL